MIDVDALIAKAKAKLDKVEPVDVEDVILGDDLVTLRFWPLSGPDWRNLTATHPARPDSASDFRLGYNLDAVVEHYPRIYLVKGDDVVNITAVEPKEKPTDPDHRKWEDIWRLLDGPVLKDCGFAVWGANDFDAEQRRVEAGKASRGGRRKKRSSPANLA